MGKPRVAALLREWETRLLKGAAWEDSLSFLIQQVIPPGEPQIGSMYRINIAWTRISTTYALDLTFQIHKYIRNFTEIWQKINNKKFL